MSRPVLPWHSPLVLRPLEGKVVWIRRLPWYDTPILATAGPNTGEVLEGVIIDVRVDGGPLIPSVWTIPWVLIHSWKYQLKEEIPDPSDWQLS